MASFRKLAQEVKKQHQTFTALLQSSEGTFKLTFRTLNGIDGTWIFRGNFALESATSQGILIDHRSACASLLTLEDEEGEILTPVQILEVLYTKEELDNIAGILEKFNDGELDKLSYKMLWEASKHATTLEDFLSLGLSNKELIWDLLHMGLRSFFEADFNLKFGFAWAESYKELRPHPAALAIRNQLKKLQELKDAEEDRAGSEVSAS